MDELKPLLEKNKKAIVIVAHPDDETIWMGGCLLRYKNIDWTIFSLCRESDTDRAPKFRKVCRYYDADCIISDLDDEGELSVVDAALEAEKIIIDRIGEEKFDYIFTHGKNGEYGHASHIALNIAVEKLIKNNKLKPEAVFYFNYKNNNQEERRLVSKKDSDIILNISVTEMAEKKRIVSEMHGYPIDGIDVGYCTNPEAFKVNLL